MCALGYRGEERLVAQESICRLALPASASDRAERRHEKTVEERQTEKESK